MLKRPIGTRYVNYLFANSPFVNAYRATFLTVLHSSTAILPRTPHRTLMQSSESGHRPQIRCKPIGVELSLAKEVFNGTVAVRWAQQVPDRFFLDSVDSHAELRARPLVDGEL